MSRRLPLAILPFACVLTLGAAAFGDLPPPNRPPQPPAPPDAPQAPEPAKERAFRFTYEAKFAKPADGAKHLDAWIPLPLEDALQTVAMDEVVARVGGQDVPFEITKDEPYGNRMVHVGLDAPKDDLTLRWTATITRRLDAGQGTGPVLDRFKQADNLVPIDGLAAQLAKELGLDKADVPVSDRARSLYDEVLHSMQYDKVAEGYGRGDFERACKIGKGNCTDFHAKFTGIGRAAGIPVRFTMGIPLGTAKEGTAAGYHCWAHFHDGKAWTPVDISEAQKLLGKDDAKAQWFFGHLDPDRLALTVGRDLTLSPKQAGPPLLFFVYPYAEVDGVVVNVPKEARTFTWAEPVAK